MTPSEIADKLASDAVQQIDELIQERHAEKIVEACCLKELLEVAEASQTLKTCWRKTFFKGTVTVRNLDKTLIALNEKLNKLGIELDSSPKKEGR